MATRFSPFLDHLQDNINSKCTITAHYTLWDPKWLKM